MKGFYKNYIDILETIDECIQKDRITPALILLYSAIDSFSYAANNTEKKGKKVFMDWVKKWMLEKYPLPCDEKDIYSARCSLLHNQTSESDMSKKNEAKELYYAHGNASIEGLESVVKLVPEKDGKVVSIRIEDLVYSFRNGIADCYLAINDDKEWGESFNKKASKYFMLF